MLRCCSLVVDGRCGLSAAASWWTLRGMCAACSDLVIKGRCGGHMSRSCYTSKQSETFGEVYKYISSFHALDRNYVQVSGGVRLPLRARHWSISCVWWRR